MRLATQTSRQHRQKAKIFRFMLNSSHTCALARIYYTSLQWNAILNNGMSNFERRVERNNKIHQIWIASKMKHSADAAFLFIDESNAGYTEYRIHMCLPFSFNRHSFWSFSAKKDPLHFDWIGLDSMGVHISICIQYTRAHNFYRCVCQTLDFFLLFWLLLLCSFRLFNGLYGEAWNMQLDYRYMCFSPLIY